MRLYSYVVRYDIGFAPNPFDGWCTLATCKSKIRKSAAIGDWVVGTGSTGRRLSGRLVYGMRVDERLTFDEYWKDRRFQQRKPQLRGSKKRQYGDNIYHRDANGSFIQADSRHSREDGTPDPKLFADDTGCDTVLISSHFTYWGRDAVEIPSRFREWQGEIDICAKRHYKTNVFPADMLDALVDWIQSLETGYCGIPAYW